MALTNLVTSLVLDVYDHDTTPTSVKAIALDKQTRFIKATLTYRGADYPVDENATVTLTVIRPDKTGVQVTGSVVDVDNADRTGTIKGVYVELTQAALAKSGNLKAQFKVTSGEQILRTEIFQVKNGIALDGETDTWTDYAGYNLDELVETVNDVVTTVTLMESDVSTLKENFTDMVNSAYVTDSASGGVAHFEDGADNVPLKSLKVAIEPAQSGSGDPSPDNVRPISGLDSVKVTRAGKNLLDFEAILKIWGSIYTKTGDTYVITATGTGYRQPHAFAQRDINISVSAVINEGASRWRIDFLNANDTLVATLNATTSSVANVMASKIRLNYSTGGTDGTFKNIQVELGPEVTEYEPYNGNTYDISLSSAGTVYGGTLDVVTGELVIDRRLIDIVASGYSFNLMDAAIYPNNHVYKNYSIGNLLEKNNSGDISKIICNYLPPKARAVTGIGVFQVHDGNANEVRLSFPKEDRFATWASVQEWMRSLADPFVLCIPLTDSLKTTYHLTPAEVKSLLGINNIWSDAGDVEVEYRADTKLYIDKRLAEVTA